MAASALFFIPYSRTAEKSSSRKLISTILHGSAPYKLQNVLKAYMEVNIDHNM
jgi:hypothetical protein